MFGLERLQTKAADKEAAENGDVNLLLQQHGWT